MGVYIFKHKHSIWLKVGHHYGNNPYERLLHGGFSSNICPYQIRGKTYYDDMELLFWFNNLNIDDEKEIHLRLGKIKENGEWYEMNIDIIVQVIQNIGGIILPININNYNLFIEKIICVLIIM
jgi:hypothetical protein